MNIGIVLYTTRNRYILVISNYYYLGWSGRSRRLHRDRAKIRTRCASLHLNGKSHKHIVDVDIIQVCLMWLLLHLIEVDCLMSGIDVFDNQSAAMNANSTAWRPPIQPANDPDATSDPRWQATTAGEKAFVGLNIAMGLTDLPEYRDNAVGGTSAQRL